MIKNNWTQFATLFAVILVVIIGISGCMEQYWEQSMPDIEQVEVGQIFTISLESNPTTGYKWNATYDTDFVELVDHKYVPAAQTGVMLGAGGTEIYRFRAIRRGITRVRMSYKREWEEGTAKTETRTIKIIPTSVKPSTVKDIATNMKALAGQVVVIKGEFRGWDVGDEVLGTLISRSDWGIRDNTGTIYVMGPTGGLSPIPSDGDVGKSILLVALVEHNANTDVNYLRSLKVDVQ